MAYLPHNDRKGMLMSLNVVCRKTTSISAPRLDDFLQQLVGRKLLDRALAEKTVLASLP
jgi:hypothetical protein